jgi:uncharacterized protein GlcG (DUF336 family)
MAGITLGQAMTIVDAALRRAREMGCAPLAVAVLDDGGHLKAFAREDGAGIVRPQIAMGKAWGAIGMGMGSRAFARRVAEQPQQRAFFSALNAMSGGRVVPAAGGVLIKDGQGVVVGAVGISGDVSDKDEACALAGIAAAELTGDTG